jgi:hypothetical protein
VRGIPENCLQDRFRQWQALRRRRWPIVHRQANFAFTAPFRELHCRTSYTACVKRAPLWNEIDRHPGARLAARLSLLRHAGSGAYGHSHELEQSSVHRATRENQDSQGACYADLHCARPLEEHEHMAAARGTVLSCLAAVGRTDESTGTIRAVGAPRAA